MDQFFSFLQEYLLLLLGIPVQLIGLLIARTLRGYRLVIPACFIFAGSFLLLLTFILICLSQVFAGNQAFSFFAHWLSEDGVIFLFGVWSLGMITQMIGVLLMALRHKASFTRIAALEQELSSLRKKQGESLEEKPRTSQSNPVESLSFADIGSKDDAPLLFMHGLGSSRKQTTSALTSLQNTRLIAPDMPGHGESLSFDPSELNFNSFADKAVAILDELGIEKTNIGGLSMGSGIALNIALRYPERVKKIIILRPSWLNEAKPSHLSLVAKVGQWLDKDGEEMATQKLALNPDYQSLVEENIPVAESITAMLDRPKDDTSTQVLFKMWEDRPFEDLSQLEAITNSTLVLDTTRDELHPQSIAVEIAKALPNSETATLPPRYHEGKAYQEALNAAFNSFLEQ